MPRYFPDGSLAINKRVSERLQNKLYQMELNCTSKYKIWAYRKAAWTLEDLTESVAEIYTQKGKKGLENLKSVGKSLATEIEVQLQEIKETGERLF
jgi:DNA polymerase/3'-5' exonuclease PolX